MSGSTVRQPRLRILCNGMEIRSALSVTATKCAFFQADTFSARLALNADPAFGLAFWSDQPPPIVLDIQASLDGGATWLPLLLGQVDHCQPCVEQGLIEVEGRDYVTASLIDASTLKSYVNQTASQIAAQLAEEHGFQTDIQPTSEPVGAWDGTDRNLVGKVDGTRAGRQWDLLCSLAMHEGFDVWATGRTLHFRPAPDGEPFTVIYDQASPSSNVLSLTVEKSLAFARDMAVIVRSFSSQTGKAVSARAGASKVTANAGEARVFSFSRPNLTQSAAQDLANSIHQNMSRHERTLTFTRPGDFSLEPRQLVELQTGSPFDNNLYRIDRVEHRISFDSGWTSSIRAKTDVTE